MKISILVAATPATVIAASMDPTKPASVEIDLDQLSADQRNQLGKYVSVSAGKNCLQCKSTLLYVDSLDLFGIMQAIDREELQQKEAAAFLKAEQENQIAESIKAIQKLEAQDHVAAAAEWFVKCGQGLYSEVPSFARIARISATIRPDLLARYEEAIAPMRIELEKCIAERKAAIAADEKASAEKAGLQAAELRKFLERNAPLLAAKLQAGYKCHSEIEYLYWDSLEKRCPAMQKLIRLNTWDERKECFGPSDDAFLAAAKINEMDGVSAEIIWVTRDHESDTEGIVPDNGCEAIEIFVKSPWGKDYVRIYRIKK